VLLLSCLQVFDIVGPVCESADFLGKERELNTPSEWQGWLCWLVDQLQGAGGSASYGGSDGIGASLRQCMALLL
jgi:hypothetical protein